MKREYLPQDVFEAAYQRLQFLFEEFDNIFVSFSGGKDSGLLLNLILDYKRKKESACSIRILKRSIP